MWQQEAGKLYAQHQQTGRHAHKHRSCPRASSRTGSRLPSTVWCNGDCAVGRERGVEWVSLHSWSGAAADSRDAAGPEGLRTDWESKLCAYIRHMEALSQVCLLALQLALSWRLEQFLTHLCDTREKIFLAETQNQGRREVVGIYIFLKGASSIFVLPCWTMAERTSSGLLTMMLEPTPAVAMTLPAEVREKLAELELELSEGKKNFPTASFIMRGSYLPGPPPFTQTSRLVRRNEPATALPSHPHLELLQLVSEEGSSACDSFRNKTWSREQTCLIGSLYPDSSCTDTPMLLFEWSLSTTPELLRVSHANFLLILIENFRKMFKKHPLMKLFT